MILCTFEDDLVGDIERVAARMVEVAAASKSSVCAIIDRVPLVAYPNDCRPPGERIKNLVLAYSDGWVRSRMKAEPLAKPDTRFDPKFACEICEISSLREEMLRKTLEAFVSLSREKLPADEEIAVLASAADVILRTTKDQQKQMGQFQELLNKDQRDLTERFRELLKP